MCDFATRLIYSFTSDDGRGVEEALNDQTSVTSTITMLFSKKDIAEKLRPSMELAKRFAPLTFYGLTTRAIIGGVQPPPVPSLAEQKCELPPSWHLQSLQTITSLTGGTTSHTLLRLRKITSDMPHEISAADVWKCLGELWEDVPAATIIERMGLSGVTPASELEDTRMRWKFEQSSHHYHHKHHHHHAVANPTENASFDQLGVVFTFKIEYN